MQPVNPQGHALYGGGRIEGQAAKISMAIPRIAKT
jgi:hypothetical protein